MKEKKLHKHEKELIFNRFFFMFKYSFKELTRDRVRERNLDGEKSMKIKPRCCQGREKFKVY